ncbi:hypothetical protein B296_00006257 [Ensete ventricosum]|uniref:Uncharacterized protein n=1 Tax=Ensete ventricosum TaxID=4639 RepID=A0A426ZB34_ENSVE|nr:hypothetical protein B296_00006257 [Ensete ventricosum]
MRLQVVFDEVNVLLNEEEEEEEAPRHSALRTRVGPDSGLAIVKAGDSNARRRRTQRPTIEYLLIVHPPSVTRNSGGGAMKRRSVDGSDDRGGYAVVAQKNKRQRSIGGGVEAVAELWEDVVLEVLKRADAGNGGVREPPVV